MAPPMIPAPRAAVRRRRRSPGDLLIGLLAIAALAVLTAGVPFALVTVFGLPIPHAAPSLSLLTRPLTVPAILKVLSVLVWLAWIQLVCCVVAEIRAAVRNAGMPRRIPLAGGTQALVHQLVTAALLVFAAGTALSPALAHHAPAPAHSASAPRVAGSARGTGSAQATGSVRAAGSPRATGSPQAASPGGPRAGRPPEGRGVSPPHLAAPPQLAPSPRPGKLYVVKPPVGRFHESLWEIAQRYLGDGRRYREIFELNKERVQPDGSRLTIASLIRPGWVLHMPGDARGPGLDVVPAGDSRPGPAPPHRAGEHRAGEHRARGHSDPGEHGAAGQHRHPGERTRSGKHGPAGERSHLGEHGHPEEHGPAGQAGHTRGPATAHGSAAGLLHPGHLTYPDELAAAALLAGGILAALGRRRREQLWQRAFGRRVIGPEGDAGRAESALRAGADEPSARLLDRGLRYLSQAASRAGQIPPAVVAAHLSHENLDLWVAPADLDAPRPWTAVGDGQVWRLPSTALGRAALDEAAGAPALYPGLVSIGTDLAGRVLVDLEAAHGVISVSGPQSMITGVLSAMVMELATSRWSDRLHLTLAGFGEDLAALAPERITALPTLGEALPALEAHAAAVAGVMAASGVSSVLEGRSHGGGADAWAPHYLISAVPPSPRERSRLLTLARVGRAAAAGYVVAGDVPGATWAWEVTPGGRLLAGALGFDVQAQLIPPRQQEAVVGLFTAAARQEGVPLGAPDAQAAPIRPPEPGSELPLDIVILGPVSVRAPGALGPDEAALVTELVVYLATHPGGVHPNVLAAALWPRGAAAGDRDAAVARATEWLGTDSIGRPHLAADASGRLRLGTGVRVDWQVFQALAGHAELAPAGSAEEVDYLVRALDLVRGRLLGGQPPGGQPPGGQPPVGQSPGRYTWLASDDLDYEVGARVADTAHRLAVLRMATRDPWGAMDAVRAGLRLAFADEMLWRDLLRAAHQTGQEDILRGVVDEVCGRAALDEVFLRMAPQTEALIDELYPSWRSTVL